MARVIKEYLWYKEGITWSKICSSKPTFRYLRSDSTYDEVNITPNHNEDLYSILGVLNTKVIGKLLDIINPTFSVQTENILSMPYKYDKEIEAITLSCITLSREDWDSHETSWDFQTNELVSIEPEEGEESNTLEWRMKKYKQKWEDKFCQLHQNEEELNRQFIQIYGLEDELTPDVPLDEITILQQGEISIK